MSIVITFREPYLLSGQKRGADLLVLNFEEAFLKAFGLAAETIG